MQGKPKYFTVSANSNDVLIMEANNNLRIIVIQINSLNISHQIFTQINLSQVGGAVFKRIPQMFTYLQSLKASPQKWCLVDSNNLTISKSQSEVMRLPLKIITDPLQINKLMLLKICLPKQHSQASQSSNLHEIKSDIQILKTNYNTVGVKLKGIGELFQSMHRTIEANAKLLDETIQRTKRLEDQLAKHLPEITEKIAKVEQFNKKQIKRLEFQIDVSQKNMLRNYATHKQETDKSFASTSAQIKIINETILKNNFPKMRKDMDEINRLFELQIKVNNHDFTPEQSLFKYNRKIHWISNKIIKNLQDVKDYNKVIGTKPFMQGISKVRIAVNYIKNNGLLFGICTKQVKQNVQDSKFNDHNMVCLNSCGYVINRGAMTLTSIAKIKSSDVIKMFVNKSQALVRWFCNDIEVAVADMGSMSKEEIYPIIGLGYFNDEVQILQYKQQKIVNEHHQTYTQQLERLNEKFGRSRKSRQRQ